MLQGSEALKLHIQTLLENINKETINIVEIINKDLINDSIKKEFKEIVKMFDFKVNIEWQAINEDAEVTAENDVDLFVTYKLSCCKQVSIRGSLLTLSNLLAN